MANRILATLIAILALTAAAPIVLAASHASAGLQKIESLAGDWEGKDGDGNPVKTSFKLIAGDTAVMETLHMSGMEEMVTLYSDDGDGIALLHYCPTNNQPRMRAVPAAGEIKQLDFGFQGAGNLPDVATGHEHRLIMEFQNKEQFTERWTWRKGGKDLEMTYQFTRRPAN